MNSHLDRFHDWPSLAQSARYRSDELARLCSVALRQLERYFAKHYGNSPRLWLNQLRLQAACELLRRGYYVKSVAYELGFTDAPHFCREFKLRYGLTPLAFVARQSTDVAPRQSMSPAYNPSF